MRRPLIDDCVRLSHDIPELSLIRGDLGIVRSTWFAPTVAYEVEFGGAENACTTRALLLEEQVEVEEPTPDFVQVVPAMPEALAYSPAH